MEANAIKNGGTRMLTVGVGAALDNPASVARLTAVTGPQVVTDADLANVDSLNEIDVALVTNFEDLAAFLRSVVLQLCSPSLTIRKLAQTADNATYAPAPGWAMTDHPDRARRDASAGSCPNTTPATSKTVVDRRQRVRPVPVGTDSGGARLAGDGAARRSSPATPPGDRTRQRLPLRVPGREGQTCAESSGELRPRRRSFTLDPDRAGDRHLHGLELVQLPAGHRGDEGQRPDRGPRGPHPGDRR